MFILKFVQANLRCQLRMNQLGCFMNDHITIHRRRLGKSFCSPSSCSGAWTMAVLVLFLLSPFVPHVLNPLGNQPALAGQAGTPDNAVAESQGDYLIGPGDVLEILVWQEPGLSRTVRVRLDGKISLPLADEIQAAGKTPMQVKKLITKALSRFVDAPAVYVLLQENRSKRIYIVGKVNAPGEYVMEKDTTLLQAISMAKGFTEWADKGDIVVIRKGPQGQFHIRADYQRAVSGKDIEQNILLQPDDVIVVP